MSNQRFPLPFSLSSIPSSSGASASPSSSSSSSSSVGSSNKRQKCKSIESNTNSNYKSQTDEANLLRYPTEATPPPPHLTTGEPSTIDLLSSPFLDEAIVSYPTGSYPMNEDYSLLFEEHDGDVPSFPTENTLNRNDETNYRIDGHHRNPPLFFVNIDGSSTTATATATDSYSAHDNTKTGSSLIDSAIQKMGLVAQKSVHCERTKTVKENYDTVASDSSTSYDTHSDIAGTKREHTDDDMEDNVLPDDVVIDSLSTYLTEDVIIKIMNFCSVYDIVHGIGMLNHYYYTLSYNNSVGWDVHYQTILQTKCHVAIPPQITSFAEPTSLSSTNTTSSTIQTMNKRKAYEIAIIDSKRQYITTNELCYDIATRTGTIWSFRFKESAGIDWTSVDPWYLGQTCRKMIFLQNGTMMQVVSSSSSSSPTTTTTDLISTGSHHHHQSQTSDNDGFQFVEPPLRMTWRFLTRPMDLPTRPIGSYVRIQVGGRDVPTYATLRSPTGNWGFVLESCWGIYGSFELPKRILPNQNLTRDTTSTNLDQNDTNTNSLNGRVLRRGSDGSAIWVPMDEIESTTPTIALRQRLAQQQHYNRPIEPADMQDETLRLTNEIQWREAFLYNVGARVLPEGDEATYEFDRFWQNDGNN
jgi:hypothetical protein